MKTPKNRRQRNFGVATAIQYTPALDLVGTFRRENPLRKRYTWYQPKSNVRCRLDYFFASEEIIQQ
uniref:Uncharacterized protein n=1 Tax=Romanomermis culicivorax TaxID=13658 RepID=A0A915K1T5_ROMCU